MNSWAAQHREMNGNMPINKALLNWIESPGKDALWLAIVVTLWWATFPLFFLKYGFKLLHVAPMGLPLTVDEASSFYVYEQNDYLMGTGSSQLRVENQPIRHGTFYQIRDYGWGLENLPNKANGSVSFFVCFFPESGPGLCECKCLSIFLWWHNFPYFSFLFL